MASTAPIEMAAPPRPTASASLRAILLRPELAAVGGLALTLTIFSLLKPALFLARPTAITVASTASELGIVAVCVTLLMISGHFDLSVGAIVGFSGYGALYAVRSGSSAEVATLCALLCGVTIGVINGVLVVTTRLHSFIVTMGMMLVIRSALNVAVQGVPTKLNLNPAWASFIAGPNLGGLRMSLLWFVVLIVLSTVFLLRTPQGNWAYAMGQNRTAAQNLGVPVRAMTIFLFGVSGFGAALLGTLQAARFDSVDGSRGFGLELYVISVIVVGGASLFGGYGTTVGTMLGAFIFAMIQSGLVLAGAPGYYFEGLVGISLFIAVFLNEWFLRNVDRFRGRPTTTAAAAARASSEVTTT
jgi:simple sugar transport system permease protein